jgi:hypothetical protein
VHSHLLSWVLCGVFEVAAALEECWVDEEDMKDG